MRKKAVRSAIRVSFSFIQDERVAAYSAREVVFDA